MFKNTYQSGLLSIFYSCGSDPLALWDTQVSNGHIKRLTDKEVNSLVLEIVGTNVSTTYITCPKRKDVLGIRLPFLVMVVKNLRKYFTFEITILDDRNMRRRFRISNFQSTTKIKPFCTTMPIGLSGGWNQIQFNLADFTRRAYGSQFMEALRVQIHANARLRRIYFCDRLYTEEELPHEYKLFVPLVKPEKKLKEVRKEETKPIADPRIASVKEVPKDESLPDPETAMVSPISSIEVDEETDEGITTEKKDEETVAYETHFEIEGEGHAEEHAFEEATEALGEIEGEYMAEGNVAEYEGQEISEPNNVEITEIKDLEISETKDATPQENEAVVAANT